MVRGYALGYAPVPRVSEPRQGSLPCAPFGQSEVALLFHHRRKLVLPKMLVREHADTADLHEGDSNPGIPKDTCARSSRGLHH